MADIHLDSPFRVLASKEDFADKRRLEQRESFKKVIKYIKEEKISFLFISGDLYEQEYVRESTIEYINNLFKEIPNTKIFISPGNHDPYLLNSFYNTFNWNENVTIFDENIKRIELEEVDIYGYGFSDFYCTNSGIEEIEIKNKEKINILISHGALDASKTQDLEYNPINSLKLKKLGFDYIALGHIHKPSYNDEEDQRIVYPGSPLSLGFDELGKHGFISGQITKERLKLEFIETDKREFIEKEIDISECNTNEEVIELMQDTKFDIQNLYKIILVGSRYFPLNIEEISKLCEIENIVKIKDKTKAGIDYEAIAKENSVKGIFVKRMLERQKEEGLDKDFVEKTIEIGLEVL
jgi:DNA repair exonuclease SbcCD nuclease subunit